MTMKYGLNIIGFLLDKVNTLYFKYKTRKINKLMGGGKRYIFYPYTIEGIKNIVMANNVTIGVGSTIFTTGAKLIFKGHFVSGPHLTVITGDHISVIGKFFDEVSMLDKQRLDPNHISDKDVIIEEDVWCGANVCILKGVTIGRGSIIAAGAVVTKDIPPYSIAGGVPAKVIRKRMEEKEIAIHESLIYR